MLSSIFAVSILACVGALAKPEQIRAVQDPIYHFYLQSYPQNGKLWPAPIPGRDEDGNT